MGSKTTNYNWDYGSLGLTPWWTEWANLWTQVDTELYKRSKDLIMQGHGVYGSEASGGDLYLYSTTHPTKGKIYFGANAWYLETAQELFLYQSLANKPAIVTKNVSNGQPHILFLTSAGVPTSWMDAGGYVTGVAIGVRTNLLATYNEATGEFSVSNYGIMTDEPPSCIMAVTDIPGPTFLAYSSTTDADSHHFAGYEKGGCIENVHIHSDGSVNLFKRIETEKVTNGSFATDLSGWTGYGVWTWNAGTALHTPGNTLPIYQPTCTTRSTGRYRLTFSVVGGTAGTITPWVGETVGTPRSFGSATYTEEIVAGYSTNLQFWPSSDFDGAIDNVSLKQISGYGQGINLYFDYSSPTNYANRLRLSSASGVGIIAAESAGALAESNVDIAITPLGTGLLKFGTYSAKGAEAFDGYITIKDATGNSRKIMTCA